MSAAQDKPDTASRAAHAPGRAVPVAERLCPVTDPTLMRAIGSYASDMTRPLLGRRRWRGHCSLALPTVRGTRISMRTHTHTLIYTETGASASGEIEQRSGSAHSRSSPEPGPHAR